MILGVSAGADMEEATTGLRVGDLLVLYTDGLVKRRDESLESGLERLAAAAQRAGVTDPEVLCEALLEAMVPATATRDDDLAILVARVACQEPAPGAHRLAFEPSAASVALARGSRPACWKERAGGTRSTPRSCSSASW